jgi:energy-converting hydrogenase Eha subunit B
MMLMMRLTCVDNLLTPNKTGIAIEGEATWDEGGDIEGGDVGSRVTCVPELSSGLPILSGSEPT